MAWHGWAEAGRAGTTKDNGITAVGNYAIAPLAVRDYLHVAWRQRGVAGLYSLATFTNKEAFSAINEVLIINVI